MSYLKLGSANLIAGPNHLLSDFDFAAVITKFMVVRDVEKSIRIYKIIIYTKHLDHYKHA